MIFWREIKMVDIYYVDIIDINKLQFFFANLATLLNTYYLNTARKEDAGQQERTVNALLALLKLMF